MDKLLQDVINGSDVLVEYSAGGEGANSKATGHCTGNDISFSTETKERAVKPLASLGRSASLFKEKGITSKSVTISSNGLLFDGEGEYGAQAFLDAYDSGTPITVRCILRGSTTPWLTGKFVMTSLELSAPAQDDSTYSVTLENTGAVTINSAALVLPTAAASEL